ncbi:MAG: ATP-binding protein [Synergistes sp.]|nr:ATP-binding protein [Synergistes sp.]
MLGLISYRALDEDRIFRGITDLIDEKYKGSDAAEFYCSAVSDMAAAAERAGISGSIWHIWIALLIAKDESEYALSHERLSDVFGTLHDIAEYDLAKIYPYINADFSVIDAKLGVSAAQFINGFVPSRTSSPLGGVAELSRGIANAGNACDLHRAVKKFYLGYGAGKFAVHCGFRWDAHERALVPAAPLEDISLSSLFGYEEQKKTVVDNTLSFLEGRPSNNVLLYGEGGTGKSSTIKALLNEYAGRGLRMIEVYKHQINDLETILSLIKGRRYRFILFMDDLSFEPSELEYKYLKAFIEGGLERRPENVLIYATSNRRHLIKETWSDRTDKDDDMHESETMQEKMSLADRFGLLVRYFAPEQAEYLRIARTLASEYGVPCDGVEFERGAIQWELRHGGFSGRSARQYIEHLAGKKSGSA